jgi:N-acetyl-D-muramate 6-phosphate phosphatase
MTQAVLFDLDGTLADTAPDLAHALNLMRSARGLAPVPLTLTRPVTSQGARGLLHVAFKVHPGSPNYDAMREEFLAFYSANLCRETRLFAGMPELLDELEARRLAWGVVTNKQERFALPLMEALGLGRRTCCVIGGDTTPHSKPHPEPLWAAARRVGVDPAACIYVGDDRRDVEAAQAAGMRSVVVRWGYLNGGDPENWQADRLIDRPRELLELL